MNVFPSSHPIDPAADSRRPIAVAGAPCLSAAAGRPAAPSVGQSAGQAVGQWVGAWQQWADRLRSLLSQFAAPAPALAA